MAQLVVQTSKRLSAERQIHAAIKHYRAGDFECAITLCAAADGQMPEPSHSETLFRRMQRQAKLDPLPDGEKDDFNYAANWMKHGWGTDECEIEEIEVKLWLYRAISKYHAPAQGNSSAIAGVALP
jgi:hypothetical protein